jgi:hypothetical protein
VPTLNRKTKSPKIILEKRDNIIIIKREPSKKRWKLLDDFKN